jgi:hypothetical protein
MEEAMQHRDITPPCNSHKPVSHWRTCDACARNRQAKIADVAADIERKYPSLAWITLTPDSSNRRTIDAIRDAYLRQADAQAGIWTIERGGMSGKLHCNIITNHHTAPRTRAAEIHIAQVRGSVRDIAAYISKRSQIPDLSHYPGRIFGKFGMLRDFLITSGMPEIVQAKSLEMRAPEQTAWERFRPASQMRPAQTQETKEDFKANMRRHLPRIFSIIDAGTHKKNQG